MHCELLNEKQVAQLLGLPVSTLQFFRRVRRGPVYIKLGRLVRYRRSDLDAWMQDCARSPEAAT